MSIRSRFGLSVEKRFILEWTPESYIWKVTVKKGKRNKWIWAAILVVFTGSVIFIYQMFFRKAVFTGKDKTVAVLPFINLGADSSDEYLNDGMTEEIINQLSKIYRTQGCSTQFCDEIQRA